jgi:hypothetical protein
VQPDLMPARLVQKPVAQAMTTWLRRRGAGLWVPKELVDVQRLRVRLGLDERLQPGRQLLENVPGLSAGEALARVCRLAWAARSAMSQLSPPPACLMASMISS